jgi:AraC-like DNA-binding protein
LEWATTRLGETDEPIAQIALDAGFADQSHLTRAFKQHTGLTPAEYRRALGR